MITIVMGIIIAFLVGFAQAAEAKNYGESLCNSSDFFCYQVKPGEHWNNLFPNEAQRDLVMRINRMNTRLYPGLILALPRSNDANFMDYSPMAKRIEPPGVNLIFVSLHEQAFGAYSADGVLQHWGPVSGAGYCADVHRQCHTPIGQFSIQSKRGFKCVSTKFPVGKGGAPMPYCMFFHGGFALHGSYEVPGFNASHGCVRMFVNDAKWLNQEFTANSRTPVVVNY